MAGVAYRDFVVTAQTPKVIGIHNLFWTSKHSSKQVRALRRV